MQVGTAFRDIVKHFDSSIDVVCISTSKHEDPTRQAIMEQCANFIDITGSTSQKAMQIRELDIDILIDMATFTGPNMEVIAYQPAALHVSYYVIRDFRFVIR